MQNLLREQVSIRDLVLILEAVGDHIHLTKDVDLLTEYVRAKLVPSLHQPYVADDGAVHAISMSPALEKEIIESVRGGDASLKIPNLPPDRLQAIYGEIKKYKDLLVEKGLVPVMIVSPSARMYSRKMTETVFQDLAVLSITELPTTVEIQFVGSVQGKA